MNNPDYARNLASRVSDIYDKLVYSSDDDSFEDRLTLTCAVIQADAIRDLASAVMCITTGTTEVMGIAESLHLIEEKFAGLDCGRELMEIAESIKDKHYD